ncbi:MAG TPA: 4-hydroxy-tetrahydrodipicolinate synthase [Bacteroidales bacterium]|nr:4-hydroxy-tetrahydrodipicolinate synthase [Bacteroidales bacterium]
MSKHPVSFKGTGVAVVTPFTASGAIDFPAFGKLLEHLLAGKCDYIVLLGTTGESATVSKLERKALIEFTVKKLNKRVPLMLGVGGNSTSDVVLAIHGTPFKGVDAILSVCPYYNKPQQEGIFRHFKTIADASPVPVMLYTVPGRTGSNISAATTLRLAREVKNIIGIKEASGNFDQIFQVLRDRPEGFLVVSGEDALTLPMMAAGADGVISVVANAYPAEYSQMVRHGLAGDFEKARKLHYLLLEFTSAIFADGSPAGVKAALEIKKICRNFLRLPLVPVNKEVYARIKNLVAKIEKS